MIEELSDIRLVAMRGELLGYSTQTAYTDKFRQACSRVADLIGQHLQGRGDDATCAAGIKEIFNDLAPVEVERLARVDGLDMALCDAFEAQDPVQWRDAFKRLLDSLSESHLLAFAEIVAMVGQGDAAFVFPADLKQAVATHQAPDLVQ